MVIKTQMFSHDINIVMKFIYKDLSFDLKNWRLICRTWWFRTPRSCYLQKKIIVAVAIVLKWIRDFLWSINITNIFVQVKWSPNITLCAGHEAQLPTGTVKHNYNFRYYITLRILTSSHRERFHHVKNNFRTLQYNFECSFVTLRCEIVLSQRLFPTLTCAKNGRRNVTRWEKMKMHQRVGTPNSTTSGSRWGVVVFRFWYI